MATFCAGGILMNELYRRRVFNITYVCVAAANNRARSARGARTATTGGGICRGSASDRTFSVVIASLNNQLLYKYLQRIGDACVPRAILMR